MRVLVLATFDTKGAEAGYLIARLEGLGLGVDRCDISLNAGGAQWSAAEKLAGMETAIARAAVDIAGRDAPRAVVAIGGGTGGQMALRVLHALPETIPKILVSTLAFDPRHALADSAIILVPTIADLCGLNATTRAALDRTAAIAFGLCRAPVQAMAEISVGVTSLSITGAGTDHLRAALQAAGHDVTVFHANGFGGAAFARWAQSGAFSATIDYTPHEVTRLHVAGAHVPMPTRFTAMGHLPRVLLPGGVNFIGLGEASLMPDRFRARPHYAHSPLFTHVKCTAEEMAQCADILGRDLARGASPTTVLIPMGGFSSEDRPGGAIEDATLRHVFADTLATHLPVTRLPGHINAPEVAHAAAAALADLMKDTPDA